MRAVITCGRCNGWWQGNNTCHCGACHQTFAGVTGFDLHRRHGVCAWPADIGLVPLAHRTHACWGKPKESEESNDDE